MDQKRVKNKSVDGITKKEKRSEENFFSDLDKKSHSFSTFWLVIILILITIFVVLISLAISLKRKNIDTNLALKSDSINLVSFSQRLSSVKNDGQAVLIFNGLEFAKAAGADDSEFPLKNASFEIDKDSIYLKGRIKDSIIPWTVKIKIIALVKDQKFSLLVAPDTMENMVIYGQNKDKIESVFNKNINQILTDKGFIADEVLTSKDSIELHVIKEVK